MKTNLRLFVRVQIFSEQLLYFSFFQVPTFHLIVCLQKGDFFFVILCLSIFSSLYNYSVTKIVMQASRMEKWSSFNLGSRTAKDSNI